MCRISNLRLATHVYSTSYTIAEGASLTPRRKGLQGRSMNFTTGTTSHPACPTTVIAQLSTAHCTVKNNTCCPTSSYTTSEQSKKYLIQPPQHEWGLSSSVQPIFLQIMLSISGSTSDTAPPPHRIGSRHRTLTPQSLQSVPSSQGAKAL